MNVCHYFFEGGKLKRSQLCGRYGCREENYIYKENALTHIEVKQAEAAWTGNRFVEPSLVRRTSRIARQLAESPEAFELFTRQERLGDAFTLNVTLFKSFYFNASRLTLMLSVRNLLNDRDQLFSGYESPRVRRIRTADTYVYRPLDTRYLYAYPRTFYASISYKF